MAEITQKNRDMAGKMSSVEFSCASANLKLSADALAAARRVLVDGVAQSMVCSQTGASKQTVNYWVSRVADAFTRINQKFENDMPPGWLAAVIALPEDQMLKVKAQAELAAATLRAREILDGQSD